MAIQLKHESGGRTIYHSIIIGKVSNGKVKSVFSAETGESISTIVGHVVGTLSSGQGYVSEIPAGRYFKPRTHHIVQGVVDIYRLRF